MKKKTPKSQKKKNGTTIDDFFLAFSIHHSSFIPFFSNLKRRDTKVSVDKFTLNSSTVFVFFFRYDVDFSNTFSNSTFNKFNTRITVGQHNLCSYVSEKHFRRSIWKKRLKKFFSIDIDQYLILRLFLLTNRYRLRNERKTRRRKKNFFFSSSSFVFLAF